MRSTLCSLVFATLGAPLLSPPTSGQELQQVLVTNFPDRQTIEGEVTIRGTVRHSILVDREGVSVTPAKRSEVGDLIEGRAVSTDGFTAAVLSLQGEMSNRLQQGCRVGAALVPDTEPVLRALREGGVYQFALETVASVAPGAIYFDAEPVRVTLGFPRYRLFFHNSCSTRAEVSLYVYLTTS